MTDSRTRAIAALSALRERQSGPANIVSFVGENQNGVLYTTAEKFMALLQPYGFTGHVIDLNNADWRIRLQGLLEAGVTCAWGPAGVGAWLRQQDTFLWDKLSLPFISVLADNPCHVPRNHKVPSTFVANGYLFQDWMDMQRTLIRSRQIASLIPLAAIKNERCNEMAWSQRPHRMVFLKNANPPETHRNAWAGLPRRFRAVLEDATAAALAQGVGDITGCFLASLDHHGLCLEGRQDVLFGLMKQVDLCVRDARATAMVKALLDLPVLIIGEGWDHVKTPGCRATFLAGLPASEVQDLYAGTQFLLNTMPNFSTRTHERVLGGFAAKCCVVSNENQDMRNQFGGLPNYIGVDTESPALADRLAEIYFSDTRYDDLGEPAHRLVATEFSGEAFMLGVLELADEVRSASLAYFHQTSPDS